VWVLSLSEKENRAGLPKRRALLKVMGLKDSKERG
jgi:hypothetical protein